MNGTRVLLVVVLATLSSCTSKNNNYGVLDGAVDAPGDGRTGGDGWASGTENGTAPGEPTVVETGPGDTRALDGPHREGPALDGHHAGEAHATDGHHAEAHVPDGKPHDTHSPFDTKPWPDSASWKCTTNGDCNDKLNCTADVCTAAHTCTNTLLAGTCLIGGVCYFDGDVSSTNSCAACVTTKSTTAWSSLADKAPCDSDKISCTDDFCKSGTCTHTTQTGFCLIGGSTCVGDGTVSSSDTCQECVASVSQSAYTFIAGKACSTGSGAARMCVSSSCMGWYESTYEPAGTVYATRLRAVDYISPAAQVWAAGVYQQTFGGAELGVLAEIDLSTPKEVLASYALRGISYRLAVGDSGVVYYHNGTQWAENKSFETAIGNAARAGVWAAKTTGGDVFYLSGYQTTASSIPGVYACTYSTSAACTAHSGFEDGALFGPIAGTLTSSSALGPLWTAKVGGGNDDLYYNAGSGTSWTTSSPGCADTSAGTTACSNTSGDYTDLHASSSSDVWATGGTAGSGFLLHYDGSAWSKVTTTIPTFSTYRLDSVYASPSESLVVIAGRLGGGTTGTQVVVFAYNPTLKRWFGPHEIIPAGTNNTYDQIHDLGGKAAASLWAVGTKRVVSSGYPKQVGWYLQLK
jgi:hypothetical protein